MSDVDPIRRTVSVPIPPDRAFELFTTKLDSWWPLDMFSRASSEFEGQGVKTERVEFPSRAGAEVLEHLSNGESLPWGEVLVWEPPARFVLAWKPHPRPDPPTEVEVRFVPEGDRTRVDLEHRGWERLGQDAAEGRGSYDSGWAPTLARFAEAASAT
jgi:uncharacterized protein YndB with AHSA1/START domain